MTFPETQPPFVAIACGGTGGHLFPGLAVAEQLKQRGCAVALLISPKEIDQEAVKSARDMKVFTLPAVGLQNRNYLPFAGSFAKSLLAAWRIFRRRTPAAVLAMGGFTSAPPIFAAKDLSIKTFLHESNTIPGRANRLLARFVDEAFVGFPETAARLKARKITATGTPVRPGFSGAAVSPACCSNSRLGLGVETRGRDARATIGLDPNLPAILVVGGSQGASGLNKVILSALPLLAEKNWQWLHLTGAIDFEKVKAAYAAQRMKAVVKPFLAEMDLALGAATAAVSRAGASSLAEMAAMRVPSLLVPFPAAADNHQFFNAAAFEKTGAAKLLQQKTATPEMVAAVLTELVEADVARAEIQNALAQWHEPRAADRIAERILQAIAQPEKSERRTPVQRGKTVPGGNPPKGSSALQSQSA